MKSEPALLVIAATGMLGFAAYQYINAQQQSDGMSAIGAALDSAISSATDAGTSLLEYVGVSMWNYEKVPTQYREAISQAETANGLPPQMLARLLYQESHYRPDIISGAKASPVGALGIAQFMPATAKDLGLNPLDPLASIAAAGKYLGGLYKQTGGWDKALAAYNWGVGNVRRKGLAMAPAETRNYYKQILADIGLGAVYA